MTMRVLKLGIVGNEVHDTIDFIQPFGLTTQTTIKSINQDLINTLDSS